VLTISDLIVGSGTPSASRCTSRRASTSSALGEQRSAQGRGEEILLEWSFDGVDVEIGRACVAELRGRAGHPARLECSAAAASLSMCLAPVSVSTPEAEREPETAGVA
jgi:hypothetical protein